MCGRAEIRVEGNNSTNVDWCLPNPRLIAFPEFNNVFGYGWPEGSEVHLTINDPSDFDQTVTVGPAPWDPNDIMAFFDFGGSYDLKPGDVVTLSGSGMERTYTVQNLGVTEVDIRDDFVAGTADVGATVHVGVHGYGGSEMILTVEDGTWMARFWDVGFDLVEGMCGRSEIRDDVGNATAVDWCYPVPHFTVFPEWDYIEGWEWAHSEVFMHVDDSATPDEWDFYAVSVSEPTPWDPNSWWVRFDLKGQFDLKVGDVVTLDDDAVTRTMTIRNLTVGEINDLEDTVSGTADPGAIVNVWPHATGQQLQVTANGEGDWQVDFTDVFDLVPGECGRAEIRDGQDNGTAVDWCAPPKMDLRQLRSRLGGKLLRGWP
jgi:hypothetical protein